MLSYCFGVAMLWNIEHDLVECDFAHFIKSLQNYTTVNVQEILEKADKIRCSELLKFYEDTHPGYSKRKSFRLFIQIIHSDYSFRLFIDYSFRLFIDYSLIIHSDYSFRLFIQIIH